MLDNIIHSTLYLVLNVEIYRYLTIGSLNLFLYHVGNTFYGRIETISDRAPNQIS